MAGMNEKKTRNEMYEERARRGTNLDRMRWLYDHSSGLFLSTAAPFATAFCGVTPLAMLARWFGPRILWLTLNGVQRSLFYATAWLPAAQNHQHCSYLATVEDKHRVADMLRQADPTLDKNVDDLLREISEGIVIVWPG